MNNELKIQRCNFLPEGEMAIIKDTNTLIHNIVDSELKEKDKEIQRLNNIIDDLEQKNNLAENILYDYLYNDGKITKEKYEQFKELKEGK